MAWQAIGSVLSSIASGLIQRKQAKEAMKEQRREFARTYGLALEQFAFEKEQAKEELEVAKSIETNRSWLLGDALDKYFGQGTSAMGEERETTQQIVSYLPLFLIGVVAFVFLKKRKRR